MRRHILTHGSSTTSPRTVKLTEPPAQSQCSNIKDDLKPGNQAKGTHDSMTSSTETMTSNINLNDVRNPDERVAKDLDVSHCEYALPPVSDFYKLKPRTEEEREIMTSSETMKSYTELDDVHYSEFRKSLYSVFLNNQDPFMYNNSNSFGEQLPFLTSTPYHGATSQSRGFSFRRDLETSTGDSLEFISYSDESSEFRNNKSFDEYIDVVSE